MAVAGAFCFSLVHVIYTNWVAILFAFFGGLLFSFRFAKTHSLWLVAFEHGLWGNFLFTVGLGRFFYSGAIN